jgi:hypothetical protein
MPMWFSVYVDIEGKRGHLAQMGLLHRRQHTNAAQARSSGCALEWEKWHQRCASVRVSHSIEYAHRSRDPPRSAIAARSACTRAAFSANGFGTSCRLTNAMRLSLTQRPQGLPDSEQVSHGSGPGLTLRGRT